MVRRLIFIFLLVATGVLIFLYRSKPQQFCKIAGHSQGTTYHITYAARKAVNLQPEVDSLLRQFDLSLSSYIPASIISRINDNDTTVRTDDWFEQVFRASAEIHRVSGGLFDITVAPIVNAWGFGPEKAMDVDSAIIDSLLPLVGMEKVQLTGNRLVKADPRIKLDVNAIAQGYAVDVVSLYLRQKGIKDFMVEIGGEVRTGGHNPKGEAWHIGIDKPVDKNMVPGHELQEIVVLSNKSLATSGNYRKFFEKDGVKYAHSINPRTGYPVLSRLLSATIIADDCMTADGYATVCMVAGLDEAKRIVTSRPELEAYFIYSGDRGEMFTWMTSGMRDLIAE